MDGTGAGRRGLASAALLAALLATSGCTTRAAWQSPPLTINTAPPARYGAPRYDALTAPPVAARPPDRMAPFLMPPQRSYEPPSYTPEPEPPYSDGTPFSLDTEPAPEPAPQVPPVAEAPSPARPAAPASAVPMVGFRPMR